LLGAIPSWWPRTIVSARDSILFGQEVDFLAGEAKGAEKFADAKGNGRGVMGRDDDSGEAPKCRWRFRIRPDRIFEVADDEDGGSGIGRVVWVNGRIWVRTAISSTSIWTAFVPACLNRRTENHRLREIEHLCIGGENERSRQENESDEVFMVSRLFATASAAPVGRLCARPNHPRCRNWSAGP